MTLTKDVLQKTTLSPENLSFIDTLKTTLVDTEVSPSVIGYIKNAGGMVVDFCQSLNGNRNEFLKEYGNTHETKQPDVVIKWMIKENYDPTKAGKAAEAVVAATQHNSKIGSRLTLIHLIAGIFGLQMDPTKGYDGLKASLKGSHETIKGFDEKFFEFWGITDLRIKKSIQRLALSLVYMNMFKRIPAPNSGASSEHDAVALALSVRYKNLYLKNDISFSEQQESEDMAKKKDTLIKSIAGSLSNQLGYPLQEMIDDVTNSLPGSMAELGEVVREFY